MSDGVLGTAVVGVVAPGPVPPRPVAPAMAYPQRRYRLGFDNGRVVDVRGYCVIGRRPDVAHVTDELDSATDVALIPVEDPTRSLSRTHCALGQFEDAVWVCDVGSGNGTVLVYPNGSTYQLDAGVRYEVDAGCRIHVGAHVFTVDID